MINTFYQLVKSTVIISLISGSCLLAQEEAPRPIVGRPSIGLRFVYSQTRPFETQSATSSTTQPIADYSYSATSGSATACTTAWARASRVWRSA